MSIKKLVEFFEPCEPPIKLHTILDHITDMGVVDRIWFFGFDENPDYLLGMLAEWTTNHVYGDETRDAAVCYNANVSAEMKRLIICKEMIHLFDPPEMRVSTPAMLTQLLAGLLNGKADAKVTNVVDATVLFETAAVFQALAVLFPEESRERLYEQYKRELMSVEDIARIVKLPPEYVQFALQDRWPSYRRILIHS